MPTTDDRDWGRWLQYSISPRRLHTQPHPAMWGNGRLEVLAELERPRVTEMVCFGYDTGEALAQGLLCRKGEEEHLVAAVYDAVSGGKYLLSASPGPMTPRRMSTTFRPDRQRWRYAFDDLRVDVSLILPRMAAGYLFKVEPTPVRGNSATRWYVHHQIRRFKSVLRMTDAHHDTQSGEVWYRNHADRHVEAVGATGVTDQVNLGQDGAFFTNVMARVTVTQEAGRQAALCYLGRAFGPTAVEAKEALGQILGSPRKLEQEAVRWWRGYLNAVPRLETPDEEDNKTFLWSWPNFRMNQIDVPVGAAPAGYVNGNNARLREHLTGGFGGDQGEAGAVNLLHDPGPQRDLILFILRNTRKTGLLIPYVHGGKEAQRSYPTGMAYGSGLLYKYVVTTGDLGLLSEDIGGLTVLERFEAAVEAQIAYLDESLGLYWTDDEMPQDKTDKRGYSGGMGPNLEAVTRYRGGAGTFYNDTNAMFYGTFVAMADLMDLVSKRESADRYRKLAERLAAAIQQRMWNPELQFYGDLKKDGTPSDYLGIGGFITGLGANHVHRPGGLATPEQAQALARWAAHPDFSSPYGVTTLARRSPYFDPDDNKGYNSSLDMHWCIQVPTGLYAHGCYEEAHRQLHKVFRRLSENGGLGPRFRGEVNQPDTGAIMADRFSNYPCMLSALVCVTEGAFGLRWTADALTVNAHLPWEWANLHNMKIRGSRLDVLVAADGGVRALINGKEVAASQDGTLRLPWSLFGQPKTTASVT